MENSTDNIKKNARFKNFSPEKKLLLSMELYHSARKLKIAALRTLHPEMSDEQIEKKVKEIFLNARS
ncbi:MAG: hypothetical protein HYS25_06340 [Ignavibacteriales bacterium]|nr:hypothetical protein [Ignavibacteriales bacterium]